ncbi:MAG: aspartyl-tRNA amidotransferase [Paenibacillus sp.]|nr:aspartyl-tRNA amidotransferase [Paenibacillus sp.]
MNLSERLNDDMKQAMRSQDKFKLSTIRMMRSSVKNLEIDLKRPLEDNEVLDILSREIKIRKDSLQEFLQQKLKLLVNTFPSS